MATQAAEILAPAVQPEDLRWAEEVDAGLPLGGDATAAELRIDYLLERIAEEQARIAHVKDFTTRRIVMVQVHADGEIARAQRHIQWLENGIRGHAPMDAKGFKSAYGKKSCRLPHGEYGFRSSPETLAIEDESVAVAWAEMWCPEAVRVEKKIAKAALKAVVSSTGEYEGPGWRIVPGHESFFVRAGGAS